MDVRQHQLLLVIAAVTGQDRVRVSLREMQGGEIWYPNWVKLAPNGTNLGLFKISFSTFWLAFGCQV